MGNTVVWKPAATSAFSSYFMFRLLQAAGLLDGVVNLVYGPGALIGDAALSARELAGVHFTGSTPVFQGMWKAVADRIADYRAYPRLVGETGGKDFILAHPSADAAAVATAIVRGSFEYQGQKCSAASRVYVPKSMWDEVRDRLAEDVPSIAVGDVADFENFMGAVIDEASFRTQRDAIEEARAAGAEIIAGGEVDDSQGWFVRPTVIRTEDRSFRLLRDEPLRAGRHHVRVRRCTLGRHAPSRRRDVPYGLTGAVFANDRAAVQQAHALVHSAGNFYVNDKPTGAVVGQQPFGGSRASGTNDKAGSMWNLIRWVSPRTVKETFVPATDYRYPFIAARRLMERWLPEDFAHPLRADLGSGHHLRPMDADDVDADYPAVMAARERLWRILGDAWGWPPETLTFDQTATTWPGTRERPQPTNRSSTASSTRRRPDSSGACTSTHPRARPRTRSSPGGSWRRWSAPSPSTRSTRSCRCGSRRRGSCATHASASRPAGRPSPPNRSPGQAPRAGLVQSRVQRPGCPRWDPARPQLLLGRLQEPLGGPRSGGRIARLRTGPTPGRSSKIDSNARGCRGAGDATRSPTVAPRHGSAAAAGGPDRGASTIAVGPPGTNTSSSRFASEITAVRGNSKVEVIACSAADS